MEIIVVAGKSQDVGKTTIVRKILNNLPGRVGAIKCSIHQGVERLVTGEPSVILEEGTDTAIFAASGAVPAIYLVSDYEHLQEDFAQAMRLVGEQDFLIIEGNSVLDYVNPDLTVFITRSGVEAKPSAVKAEAKADILIESDEVFAELDSDRLPFYFNQSRVTCLKAHLIGRVTGTPLQQVGQMLNEKGIKLKHCQLGLF